MEEPRKKAAALTDYQPHFTVWIFVATRHHGAHRVIYHRHHIQVELLEGRGCRSYCWGTQLTALPPGLGRDPWASYGPTLLPVGAWGSGQLQYNATGEEAACWDSPARKNPQGRSFGRSARRQRCPLCSWGRLLLPGQELSPSSRA